MLGSSKSHGAAESKIPQCPLADKVMQLNHFSRVFMGRYGAASTFWSDSREVTTAAPMDGRRADATQTRAKCSESKRRALRIRSPRRARSCTKCQVGWGGRENVQRSGKTKGTPSPTAFMYVKIDVRNNSCLCLSATTFVFVIQQSFFNSRLRGRS